MVMDKKFLSAEEAVSQFGLDSAKLQKLVDAGELRALADRGNWKYRRDEIEQLIQSGKLPAQYPTGEGASPSAATEDFAFLEIDENALAEGAANTTSEETSGPDSGFASDGEIMMIDSDPEVEVALPGSSSSSEIPIASSLSELGIVVKDEPTSEKSVVTDESSIIIGSADDSSLDSDSDVKVASDSDVKVVKESGSSADVPVLGAEHDIKGDSSVITPADGSSIISSDSDVRIADSGITLEQGASDSGITLEADSGITLQPDSGLTLEAAADSGLTLEGKSDSGLTLEAAADSGLTLEAAADSGISLEAGTDSGISLEAGDSGLSLTDADSGIRLTGAAPAARAAKPDDTLPEFDQMGSSDEHTAMVESFEGSSDEVETVPPPKGKKAKSAALSDSFTVGDEVQDLEIVEDLEAGDVGAESVAELEEPEDILEASDEAFSIAESGEVSDESSAVSVPVMKTVAKEPPWGVVAIIPLAACAVLLLVQGLLLWDGISTMWNGDTSKALGAAVIDTLSGLM